MCVKFSWSLCEPLQSLFPPTLSCLSTRGHGFPDCHAFPHAPGLPLPHTCLQFTINFSRDLRKCSAPSRCRVIARSTVQVYRGFLCLWLMCVSTLCSRSQISSIVFSFGFVWCCSDCCTDFDPCFVLAIPSHALLLHWSSPLPASSACYRSRFGLLQWQDTRKETDSDLCGSIYHHRPVRGKSHIRITPVSFWGTPTVPWFTVQVPRAK